MRSTASASLSTILTLSLLAAAIPSPDTARRSDTGTAPATTLPAGHRDATYCPPGLVRCCDIITTVVRYVHAGRAMSAHRTAQGAGDHGLTALLGLLGLDFLDPSTLVGYECFTTPPAAPTHAAQTWSAAEILVPRRQPGFLATECHILKAQQSSHEQT
ncbi:hypothetical protein PsYK624_121090 [Phanerochaete sordida]|uniref:Hydrophobin n=1 Tax=Phanerochaete sordida TaxID=48140 RepID=A0A9P3GJ69_9APHY|nr:hypothetical protein PsYK624_121090 [Phanerochaete sordida]